MACLRLQHTRSFRLSSQKKTHPRRLKRLNSCLVLITRFRLHVFVYSPRGGCEANLHSFDRIKPIVCDLDVYVSFLLNGATIAFLTLAPVAELVDAVDSKSTVPGTWEFESPWGHHLFLDTAFCFGLMTKNNGLTLVFFFMSCGVCMCLHEGIGILIPSCFWEVMCQGCSGLVCIIFEAKRKVAFYHAK